MKILGFFWKAFDLITDTYLVFCLVCSLLYGFKWQVGNFMSIKIPGILKRSKRAYTEEHDE